MKILSKEEVKTVSSTVIVETEQGNVVVKETFELNDDGSKGEFMEDDMIWENSGDQLASDHDNFGLIDEIETFIFENKA